MGAQHISFLGRGRRQGWRRPTSQEQVRCCKRPTDENPAQDAAPRIMLPNAGHTDIGVSNLHRRRCVVSFIEQCVHQFSGRLSPLVACRPPHRRQQAKLAVDHVQRAHPSA